MDKIQIRLQIILKKFLKQKEIILVIGAIFIIFYWTYLIIDTKIIEYHNRFAELYKQYIKIEKVVSQLQQNKKIRKNVLRGGLLSSFQNIAQKINLSDNIVSMKPNNISKKESIIVRMQSLNYSELIKLLSRIDKYTNININLLSISKSFDNPDFVDITIEITKI